MPIYEYHCSSCGRDFEKLQKVSEPPTSTCPVCGKKTKRLISKSSFALKGGGWYKDGYAGTKPASKGVTTKTEKTEKVETEKKEKKSGD